MPFMLTPEQYAAHQARFGRSAASVDTHQRWKEREADARTSVRAGRDAASPINAGTASTAGGDVARGQRRESAAGEIPAPATPTAAGNGNPSPARLPSGTPAATHPLVALCRAAGIAAPQTEFRFHPRRRWRFDFAWPERRIAVEIEGGIWTQGRHTRSTGFLNDMLKYNTATLLGWRVLRYAPDALAQAVDDVRLMMAGDAA